LGKTLRDFFATTTGSGGEPPTFQRMNQVWQAQFQQSKRDPVLAKRLAKKG